MENNLTPERKAEIEKLLANARKTEAEICLEIKKITNAPYMGYGRDLERLEFMKRKEGESIRKLKGILIWGEIE